jgi:hypothetical protein
MSSREVRIARVVRVRDERLKQAVFALEEARAAERRALSEFNGAQQARQLAERERRELGLIQPDILAFIEAEDWLRSCSIAEEIATQRLRQLHLGVERCQQRVREAHIKVRQLEQLQLRLKELRRVKENRAERALEDEIGQRAAQSQRNRR